MNRLRVDGRDQDAQALHVVTERYGAHHPFIRDDGAVFISRPGKTAGTSASIGWAAPGVVKVFTGNWSPFEAGSRYVVEDGELVSDLDALLPRDSTDGPDMPAGTNAADSLLDIVDWADLFAGITHEKALIDGIALRGRWTAYAAPGKAGKSTYTTHLAVEVPTRSRPVRRDQNRPADCPVPRHRDGARRHARTTRSARTHTQRSRRPALHGPCAQARHCRGKQQAAASRRPTRARTS